MRIAILDAGERDVFLKIFIPAKCRVSARCRSKQESKISSPIRPERNTIGLVPVVFTPFDYISHRTAVFSSIQTVKIFDEVYHTYDNVLQGLKYELRKNFVIEKYQELFGREPTKEELCLEMDKLIQKVQLEQLEDRLSHYPEAVFYSITQLRNSKPNGVETALIRILLWLGTEPEQIVGLFG